MLPEIPAEFEEQYEGQWIVWDMDIHELAAVGQELDNLQTNVRKIQDAGHEVYVHHVLPRGTVLVGDLF
ncbi:MAG: hypothetical protein NT013_23160 [Planctomycetia bacterium]|nr:hypothetical protein [Planctomycetia bacterium]